MKVVLDLTPAEIRELCDFLNPEGGNASEALLQRVHAVLYKKVKAMDVERQLAKSAYEWRKKHWLG